MTAPREPGWHPDPDHPTSLQRYWDGERWTDDSRPTGYVTQPAGTPPAAVPTETSTPVFGATPPETGGPVAARRRWHAAQVATAVAVAVVVVAFVVLVLL